MKVSDVQLQFIDAQLSLVSCNGLSNIIETKDPKLLSILFWNPIVDEEITLLCPNHMKTLQATGKWAKMGDKKPPRLLYGMGENVLLISALYLCPGCGATSPFLAHHPDLMSQLPLTKPPPFQLFLKSGVTRMAYDEIVNATLAGTSFSGQAAIFERSHGLHIGLYGEEAAQQDKHKSPSNDFIMAVFMFDFKLRLPYYERTMMEIQPHMISIDHTFKLR